jgi:hypothetical protein
VIAVLGSNLEYSGSTAKLGNALIPQLSSTRLGPEDNTVNFDVQNGESRGLKAMTEKRRDARFPMGSTIRVQKCNGGSENWMVVRGLNLSDCGVAFLADQPIQVGTLLQVELPNSRSSAIGPVRNCQRRSNQWRIGVELARPFLSMS